MTSRELCRRAMEFGGPERLPMSYPTYGVADLAGVGYTAPKDWEPSEPGVDEWGVLWKKTELENMGQIVKSPIQEWSDLDTYAFPDPDDESRFTAIAEALPEHEKQGKYVTCVAHGVFTLWERFYALRGFNQALMDPYVYPRETHELLERILDFHLRIMKNLGRLFGGRIDGFTMSDDWGIQSNTLFPVPLWREFFKDRYSRLVAAIHDAGMHAVLHTDGHINDLVPDLIDVGLDAFELHSPRVVGIEEMGRRFAGKIAFRACIDIQKTMVQGTPDDVRQEARLLLEHWGTRRGGIIPCEYDRVSIGASVENIMAAGEEFERLGMAYCGVAHCE